MDSRFLIDAAGDDDQRDVELTSFEQFQRAGHVELRRVEVCEDHIEGRDEGGKVVRLVRHAGPRRIESSALELVHDQCGIHWIVLNNEHMQWLPISASGQMFTRSRRQAAQCVSEKKRFASALSGDAIERPGPRDERDG